MKTSINTMMQLSMAMQVMYNKFNDHCFKYDLPSQVVISFEPAGKKKAYGWFTTTETWKTDGQKRYGIVIASDHLNRTARQVLETLLHEMVHLYNHIHGIQDCSRSGQYHNNYYKAAAEMAGMHVEKIPGYGWAGTVFGDELAEWVEENSVINIIDIQNITPQPTKKNEKNGKKSGFYKYICPICGKTARTTTDLVLMCGGEADKPHTPEKMEID